jgi:hypothetical protein
VSPTVPDRNLASSMFPGSRFKIAVFCSLYKLTQSLQFSRFAGHMTLLLDEGAL